MARRSMSQTVLAEAIGMAQPGLSKRLAEGRRWTADEVLRVARVLDLDVAVLYEGVEPATSASEQVAS